MPLLFPCAHIVCWALCRTPTHADAVMKNFPEIIKGPDCLLKIEKVCPIVCIVHLMENFLRTFSAGPIKVTVCLYYSRWLCYFVGPALCSVAMNKVKVVSRSAKRSRMHVPSLPVQFKGQFGETLHTVITLLTCFISMVVGRGALGWATSRRLSKNEIVVYRAMVQGTYFLF